VDNAAVIVENVPADLPTSSPRVALTSFAVFRRRTLPLIEYLEEQVRRYEDDPEGVFRQKSYISLPAHVQASSTSLILDHMIAGWIHADQEVSVLTILGDFGVGKTTTMMRVFWEQAARYLANPAGERIPILVTLKEFDRAFDMETLVERSVAKLASG